MLGRIPGLAIEGGVWPGDALSEQRQRLRIGLVDGLGQHRLECAGRDVLTEDIESHGCYYGVVCNAGIARDNAFPALSDEDWDSVIHTNLDGFYNVLQPLIMPMVRNRPHHLYQYVKW